MVIAQEIKQQYRYYDIYFKISALLGDLVAMQCPGLLRRCWSRSIPCRMFMRDQINYICSF